MPKVQGSCLCGNIKINVDGDPVMQHICHCLMCRKVSSTAFSTNIIIPEPALTVTGETKTYVIKGHPASGKTITLHFCSTCSSTIYAEPEAFPGVVAVKIGILDVEEGNDPFETLAPNLETWTCKRPSWLKPLGGKVQFEESPQ